MIGRHFKVRIGDRDSLVRRTEINEREMEKRLIEDKACSSGCGDLVEFCGRRD